MPVPVQATIENSTTNATAWKKLFQGGEHGSRNGANVRAYSGGSELWLAIVPRGSAAPTALDETVVSVRVSAGDTYALGTFGDSRNDIYIADSSFAGGISYRAWEVVN